MGLTMASPAVRGGLGMEGVRTRSSTRMWVRSNLGKDGEQREGVAIDGFKDPEGQTLTWQDSVMRREESPSWVP